MKKLFWYLRLYGLMVSQYIKTKMQYRFDFFVSTFTMILGNAAGLAGLQILLSNFPLLAGWKFEELVFIYSFSMLAQLPVQICFDHIWTLRYHVNTGTFIKYYFKPIDSLFYYVSEVVDLKGFGQLLVGIAAFAWASSACAVEWTVWRIVLLPVLMGGSALVLIGLLLAAACGCFWVKDSFAILSFINSFRDHSKYPMDIFDAAFRFVFTWILPIGFIAFYPSQFYLRDLPVDWRTWVTPAAGIAVFWIATRVWKRGMLAWSGTGS